MTIVNVSFSKTDVTPPVFLAGSFTEWNPVELEHKLLQTDNGNDYAYSKTFDITPGRHQYKIRLGPGDWWVCDEAVHRAFDASGNENNVIDVEATSTKSGIARHSDADVNGDTNHNTNASDEKVPTEPPKPATVNKNAIEANVASNGHGQQEEPKPKVDKELPKENGFGSVLQATKDKLPTEQIESSTAASKLSDVLPSTENIVKNLEKATATVTNSLTDTMNNQNFGAGHDGSLPEIENTTTAADGSKMEDMSSWKSKDKPLPPKSAMKQPGTRRSPRSFVPSNKSSVPPSSSPEDKQPSLMARLCCSRNLVVALVVGVPVFLSWAWLK